MALLLLPDSQTSSKKIIMKFTSFLIVLALALVSCNNQDKITPPKTIQSLLIGKGNLPGHSYPKSELIIDNQADWQILLDNFEAAQPGVTNAFSEKTINFDNFVIVAVIDARNSTSTIDITSILEDLDAVFFTVTNLTLGVSQDLGNPYHIVRVDKTEKPIVFQ